MARRPINTAIPSQEPNIYCADCKAWIPLPLRWARHNFENKHIKKHHPERWRFIQEQREADAKKAEESTWKL